MAFKSFDLTSSRAETSIRRTMPFGKYKGVSFYDIPVDYLIWCLKNFDSSKQDLILEINKVLRTRSARAETESLSPEKPAPFKKEIYNSDLSAGYEKVNSDQKTNNITIIPSSLQETIVSEKPSIKHDVNKPFHLKTLQELCDEFDDY